MTRRPALRALPWLWKVKRRARNFTTIAVPTVLVSWIDGEAKKTKQSRSRFVVRILEREQDWEVHKRIARIERFLKLKTP